MSKLTCLIVDDEEHSRETTKMFLEMVTEDVVVLDLVDNALSAVKLVKEKQPDFLLLDIKMPGVSGIEMLGLIPEYQGEIIFLTAHDEYALEAFKKGAIHYLLKPLDPQDLKVGIERVAQSFASRKATQSGRWMSISTSDGWTVLRKEDILRCESFKNYTTIILEECKYTLSKTLKEVERKLSNSSFFRVHNSHIINFQHIDKIIKSDGGNVLLQNGDLIPIAKTKKKEFFDWFQDRVDQV